MKTKRLHIDIESYSEIDLLKVGVHRYAEHPSTGIHCIHFALDEGPVYRWAPGKPLPQFQLAIAAGYEFRAHNAQFERVMLNGAPGRRIGFPTVPLDRWVCTAAKGAAHAIPRDLKGACKVMGTAHQKDDTARSTMLQLARPHKQKDGSLVWYTPESHPEKFERLYQYCDDDVLAERDLDNALPDLSPAEQRIYILDQIINDRGFWIDQDTARAALRIRDEHVDVLVAECLALSGFKPTQRDAVLGWLQSSGININDLTKKTLDGIHDSADSRVLDIRREVCKTSVAKFEKMLEVVCADGRVRGAFLYHGASPGRWTGRLVQPHNLAKPTISGEVELSEQLPLLDGPTLELLYESPMDALASCGRPTISAPPGKELLVSDFSSIESRIVAWLCNEEWKLKVFRTHGKVYEAVAARMFRVPVSTLFDYVKKHGKHHPWRDLGKRTELMCFGENTQVLTDCGYVPIIKVTTQMKLWDGQSWVQHEGLVCQGTRSVICLAGVYLTPEHLCLVHSEWKPAQLLVSKRNILKCALATSLANLPLSGFAMAMQGGSLELWFSALAAHQRTMSSATTCETENQLDATLVQRNNRGIGLKIITGTQILCRTITIVAGCLIELPNAFIGVLKRAIQGTKIMVVAGWRCAPNGSIANENSFDTSRVCPVGTNRNSNWTESTITKVMNRGTCVLPPVLKIEPINAKSEKCKSKSMNLKPVYDLVNAGVNHRFTILTDEGPLIVHNCGFAGGVAAVKRSPGFENIDPAPKDEEIQTWVDMWREACPNTKEMWKGLERLLVQAIESGQVTSGYKCRFGVRNGFLYIQAPSGRKIAFKAPQVHMEQKVWSDTARRYFDYEPSRDLGKRTKVFKTVSFAQEIKKQWVRDFAHGGIWLQNIVEMIGADVLRNAMVNLTETGYDLIMHVHDEAVAEVKEGEGDLNEFNALMCKPAAWMEGLPLAAAGYRAKRYSKEG